MLSRNLSYEDEALLHIFHNNTEQDRRKSVITVTARERRKDKKMSWEKKEQRGKDEGKQGDGTF